MKRILLICTVLLGFSLMLQAQTGIIVDKPKVEAKKLSKEGYKILPDALWPMKKQLEYVYEKQFTKEDGLKKDLLGVGVALDASLKEAKIGARAAAVQEIVNQVMKPMKSIISKNGGIQENDTLSVAERLRVVEEKCKQKMMSGPVLADVYKQERGKYKVKRYCSYSYKDARNMAIEFFEADLQNESERLKKALRNSANWD